MKNATHALLAALTLLPGLAAAGELQDDLAARRARLMQRLEERWRRRAQPPDGG